jgi:hypothetical protein
MLFSWDWLKRVKGTFTFLWRFQYIVHKRLYTKLQFRRQILVFWIENQHELKFKQWEPQILNLTLAYSDILTVSLGMLCIQSTRNPLLMSPRLSTESSKSHATHKSVTRENFIIMLVVILILYVGTTVFTPRATGAGATLTPSCTPSVEWERYFW